MELFSVCEYHMPYIIKEVLNYFFRTYVTSCFCKKKLLNIECVTYL